MFQTKGQFSAGKIYQAIKAWASKQFVVFNSEAAKDYFRFVLISEISEHDVGLEMLDNVYNGWTIRNSSSSLEICPVINNEEQYPIITVSRAKTTFTTVVEGVTPTANNHLATKSYIDSVIGVMLETMRTYIDMAIDNVQTTINIVKTTINTVKTVTDAIKSKSLKNIYNSTLTANKLLCTDSSGYVTTQNKYSVNSTLSMSDTTISMPNKLSSALAQNLYKCSFDQQGRCTGATAVTMPNPHLYIHKWHFDRSGTGEVNFIILTTQSTKMSEVEIGRYLASLNCGSNYWTAYPASGQASNGTIVSGIYGVPRSSSSLLTIDVYVVSYASGGSSFTERLTTAYRSIESASCTILQLF